MRRHQLVTPVLLFFLATAVAALVGCDDGAAGDDAPGGDGQGDGGPGGPGGGGDEPTCGVLMATIRDFTAAHPDMEEPVNSDFAHPGLVEAQLGPDGKPVYAPDGAVPPHTAGPAAFAEWYRDVPGVNMAVPFPIALVDAGNGVFRFESDAFFPVDGQGFGNEGNPHNFHFTTEVHTSFQYRGGETFRFTGDDDLWLFINGRLAIDLGGLHPQLSAEVDLDAQAAALGIEKGGTYRMDIFHAERHTTASNFHIETTIDCFIIE
jgi:fibro-slime domain-containing protein